MIKVAATYHPRYIMGDRNPSAALAVEAHLRLLSDYLHGLRDPTNPVIEHMDIPHADRPPSYPLTRLSLDIETYGILKGQDQTQFHPLKSEQYDRVSPENMVITVGLSWRNPEGDLRHTLFIMDKVEHRQILLLWLQRIRHEEPQFVALHGQNIAFDLMYLRYCYPHFKEYLDWPLPISDLIVTNYLHDEGRPEKSLKALAPLLNVDTYEGTGGDGFRQYDSPDDPQLHYYNIKDTRAALLCQEKLEDAIKSFYGADSEKLSLFTKKWYSDLLWFIIKMSEWGIAMDLPELARLDAFYQGRRDMIVRLAQDYFELPLAGKGSDKAKRATLDQAVGVVRSQLGVANCGTVLGRLQLTKKTSKISFAVENRNLLLEALPRSSWVATKLRLMGRYQDYSKMMTSYLTPILRGAKNGKDISTRQIEGILYPRWFAAPSDWEDGSSGGTKQVRIVASGPAIQTFPPAIKESITTRFQYGHLLWTDASQVELRMAALLSGDPVMLAEYAGQPDLHGKTACLLFGDDIVKHPQYKSKYRQAGKVVNFLMLYRGGAGKLRQSLLQDVGIDHPLEACHEAINAFWRRHHVLREWQDSLLDFVRIHGYYVLPVTGSSRLFLGSERARRGQINEICNIPVQAGSALVYLDAQMHFVQELQTRGLKSLTGLNVYDGFPIEVAGGELAPVIDCMQALPHPPYFEALCDRLGRRIPLVWEYYIDGDSKNKVEIGAP